MSEFSWQQVMQVNDDLQIKINLVNPKIQSQQDQINILKDAKKIMNQIIQMQFQYDQDSSFENIIETQQQIYLNQKLKFFLMKKDQFLQIEEQEEYENFEQYQMKQNQLYQDVSPRYHQPQIKQVPVQEKVQQFVRQSSQYDYIQSKFIQSSEYYVNKAKQLKEQELEYQRSKINKSQNKQSQKSFININKSATSSPNIIKKSKSKINKSPEKKNKINFDIIERNKQLEFFKQQKRKSIEKLKEKSKEKLKLINVKKSQKKINKSVSNLESFVIKTPVERTNIWIDRNLPQFPKVEIQISQPILEENYISFNQQSNNMQYNNDDNGANVNAFNIMSNNKVSIPSMVSYKSIESKLVDQSSMRTSNILELLCEDNDLLKLLILFLGPENMKNFSLSSSVFYKNSTIQVYLNPTKFVQSKSLLDVSKISEYENNKIVSKLEIDELIRRLMLVVCALYNDKQMNIENFQDLVIQSSINDFCKIEKDQRLDTISIVYCILTNKYLNIDIDISNYSIKLKNKEFYEQMTIMNMLEDFIFTQKLNDNQKFLINILLQNVDLISIFNLNLFSIVQQENYFSNQNGSKLPKKPFKIDEIAIFLLENLIINILIDDQQIYNTLNAQLKKYMEIQAKTNVIKLTKSQKILKRASKLTHMFKLN